VINPVYPTNKNIRFGYDLSSITLGKTTKRGPCALLPVAHCALGYSVPDCKGQVGPEIQENRNFDMTSWAFPTLDGASHSAAEASLEFGRFRVLLRQRQLLADGEPIELGTRAFEVLLVLLKANGSLVSKERLLARVWPGIAVAEDNIKVHVSALRKALGEDRDLIRTEFGRGYRFIAAVRSTIGCSRRQRPVRWRRESTQELLPRRSRRPSHGWSVGCLGRPFDLTQGAGAARRRGERRLV
jgi:DNA-binding winged helix-turn-helix (wHTH) protein